MAGKIHILRHTEGLHNLFNDRDIRDAPLSQRGYDAAEDLGRRFVIKHSNRVGAIISSPLCRSIQTSLTAFSRILDTTQYPENAPSGVKDGVLMSLDANLQEIYDLPCNTGSPKDQLLTEFPGLSLEINKLDLNWYIKSGSDSPLTQPIPGRVTEILEKLEQELFKVQGNKWNKDVIIVTHQGVIDELVPTAKIPMGEWQTFDLTRDRNGNLRLI